MNKENLKQVTVLNCNGGRWDYSECYSSIIQKINKEITLEAWILWKGNLPKKSQQVICIKGELQKTWSHCLALCDGKLTYKTRMADISDDSPIKKNEWTHIAIAITISGEVKFFINGVNTSNKTGGIIESYPFPFYVGGYWPTWGLAAEIQSAPFYGQVAELRIWECARTNDQIKENLNKVLQGNEEKLVAYWFADNSRIDKTKNKLNLSGEHSYWHTEPPQQGTTSLIQVNLPISPPTSQLWKDAEYVENGWWSLPWFGMFQQLDNNWINHQEHGAILALGTTTADIWFYDPAKEMGWFWASDSVYPNLYRSNSGEWLWYEKDSCNPRCFYNFATNSWESFI